MATRGADREADSQAPQSGAQKGQVAAQPDLGGSIVLRRRADRDRDRSRAVDRFGCGGGVPAGIFAEIATPDVA